VGLRVIALLQRVSRASVTAAGKPAGTIERGLLVLLGIERCDSRSDADRLLERLLGYRVFPDDADRMNLSVRDVGGGVLLVPQFTLAADTNRGTRPSFSSAAHPDVGRDLFEYFVQQANVKHSPVANGWFGEKMAVSLVNDGPVTFWLRVPPSDAMAT
jgi:D-tyrosyl-tRNA(Tyr) deacylase